MKYYIIRNFTSIHTRYSGYTSNMIYRCLESAKDSLIVILVGLDKSKIPYKYLDKRNPNIDEILAAKTSGDCEVYYIEEVEISN